MEGQEVPGELVWRYACRGARGSRGVGYGCGGSGMRVLKGWCVGVWSGGMRVAGLEVAGGRATGVGFRDACAEGLVCWGVVWRYACRGARGSRGAGYGCGVPGCVC